PHNFAHCEIPHSTVCPPRISADAVKLPVPARRRRWGSPALSPESALRGERECAPRGYAAGAGGNCQSKLFTGEFALPHFTAPTVNPEIKRSRNMLLRNATGKLAIRQAAINAPQ